MRKLKHPMTTSAGILAAPLELHIQLGMTSVDVGTFLFCCSCSPVVAAILELMARGSFAARNGGNMQI